MLLRALNPRTELDLFREAFSWRPNPKKHLQLNRMAFEEFSADSPDRVVIGLFNENLCAVYMFIETLPKEFEGHFTSRKDVPVADVLAGARTIVEWFHGQGGVVTAEIVERNRPVRVFVEALGFQIDDSVNSTCYVKSSCTLPPS